MTSSAAADIAFVGHTSYHSSIKDPKQPRNHRTISQEILDKGSQNICPSIEHNEQEPILVQATEELRKQNPNLNIFYSFKNSDSTIGQQPHIFNNINKSSMQLDSSSKVIQASDGVNQSVAGDKQDSSPDLPEFSTKFKQRNDFIRLSDSAVQCRQGFQDAREMHQQLDPNTNLKLSINQLRRGKEQRLSDGSTKQMKNVSVYYSNPQNQKFNIQATPQHSTDPQQQTKRDSQRHHNSEDCSISGNLFAGKHQQNQNIEFQNLNSEECTFSRQKQESCKSTIHMEQQQCLLCKLSSPTIHPSVQKAQQRIKERKQMEIQKDTLQHLRNPLTVSQQLKRHMKFQKALKSQFQQLIGSEGRLAIQNLGKATSLQCLKLSKQQALRKQHSRSKEKGIQQQYDQRLFKQRAQSLRPRQSTHPTNKKKQIIRLRYAPHLVGLSSATPAKDAREAINIIVNESTRRCSGSNSQQRTDFTRQRNSFVSYKRSAGRLSKGRSGMRLHRLLSSDQRNMRPRTQRISKRYNEIYDDCSDGSVDIKINKNVSSGQIPFQNRRINSGKDNYFINSENSSEQPVNFSNQFGKGGRRFESDEADQNYNTGKFRQIEINDTEAERSKRENQHNKLKEIKRQLSNSHSSNSLKENRKEQQWVRLSEILEDKKNFYKNAQVDCIPTNDSRFVPSSSNREAPRFETFNKEVMGQALRKSSPFIVEKNRNCMNPVQSYSRSQSKSANSQQRTKSDGRSRSKSKSSGKRRIISVQKHCTSQNSSRRYQRSASANRSKMPAIDISRSASCLSNLSSHINLASLPISPAQANVGLSYDKNQALDQKADINVANSIVKNTSGSLRFRLQRTKELVETIERSVKIIKNSRSPVRTEPAISRAQNQKQPHHQQQLSEPNHVFSNLEIPERSIGAEYEKLEQNKYEPRFGMEPSQERFKARYAQQHERVVSGGSDIERYREIERQRVYDNDQRYQIGSQVSALRMKRPYDQEQLKPRSADKKIVEHEDNSDSKNEDEWCCQAERTFGYRCLSQDNKSTHGRNQRNFKSGNRKRSLIEQQTGYKCSQSQESILPRGQFTREISGIKYDYRPLPPAQDQMPPNNSQHNQYRHLYGQYGGPSPDLNWQYDTRNIVPPRQYSKSQPNYHFSGSSYLNEREPFHNRNQGPEEVQKHEFERLIQVGSGCAENPYSRSGSHFRVKQKVNPHSGLPKHEHYQEANIKTSGYLSGSRNFEDIQHPVTTKNQAQKDSKVQQSSQSRDSKYSTLKQIYDPRYQRAIIPKLKSIKDLAIRRQLRQGKNPQPPCISHHTQETSDFDSTQRRYERGGDSTAEWNDQLRGRKRLSFERSRYCNGTRCSASKEHVRSRSIETSRGRVAKSRTRSRRRGTGHQLMKLTDLKDQIRRLQKPTFSSKMHEYSRQKPDANDASKRLDQGQGYTAVEPDELVERPHCERNQQHWQNQQKCQAKDFSQYPSESNISRFRNNENGFEAQKRLSKRHNQSSNELVPLNKLKELAKVMDQIIDIDKHVQQLKSNLVETQEQLVQQINRSDQ